MRYTRSNRSPLAPYAGCRIASLEERDRSIKEQTIRVKGMGTTRL